MGTSVSPVTGQTAADPRVVRDGTAPLTGQVAHTELYLGGTESQPAAVVHHAPAQPAPTTLERWQHNLQDAAYVVGSIAGAAGNTAVHAAAKLLHRSPSGETGDMAKVRSLDDIEKLPEFNWTVPTRAEQLARLKDPNQEYDVVIIGGGATGAGAALEAAARGLKVALIESGDFASGTSSKSTKLIHGGVRYLQEAVQKMDRSQYDLVKEGLAERGHFMRMAPHLTSEVRLVTPCYKLWEIPFYYAGLTLYDWIAGRENLTATKVLSAKQAQAEVPGMKTEGLKGAITYSDGEFNDSRMNVSLATTAAAKGAAVANYVELTDFLKEDGKITGAQVRDKHTGETWPIKGKVVINATGPFIDKIRKMDNTAVPELVAPSAGTHIFVNKLQIPEAILIPKAPNGSVAFLKPFEGGTLIGTTEEKTDITFEPGTTEDQVEYLRNLANQFLDKEHQIAPGDITSVWTGIRPLVRDPQKAAAAGPGDTVGLTRNHIVEVSDSGLVTIGGGKWTSFGRMAQDVVDAAIKQGNLPNLPSKRDETQLIGSHGYSPKLAAELKDRFGLDADVAQHLAINYGDRAIKVAELARQENLGTRLDPKHPYLEAEVVYGCRNEYAVEPADILSRRTRLSFTDEAATRNALPRVVDLMAQTLGWDKDTAAAELAKTQAFYARTGMAGMGPATPAA